MNLDFERKLPLILLLVFFALSTVGFLFYQGTVSVQQALTWEKQAQQITAKLDASLSLLLDSESGVRSFILTGNSSYLDSFTAGRRRFDRNVVELRVLFQDNQTAVAELDRLSLLVADYYTKLDDKVALRKSTDFDTAVLKLADAEMEASLAAIRQSIERIKASVMLQLQNREQQLEKALSRAVLILIVSSFAGIISLALANLVVSRESKRRGIAERELRESNRNLEKRIDERTAELRAANDGLQAADAERSKLLERERNARRDAEIANRLRDEFMATVSHELRTPLNSMLGWARLLKLGTLSDEQTVRAVNTIIKNSEIQNRLIEDLLDVARIISGKLTLERRDFDVVELLRESIDTMKPTADGKRIRINLNETDARAVYINGDRNRISQVILNLLTNAVKFSPAASEIDVRAAVANSQIAVSVADRGIGISKEFLPKVFDRFRQDAAVSEKSGGLGLGLAIVRNLVEMHGGSVAVASEGENRGSVFTVTLPVAHRAAAESAAAPR